MAPGELSQEDIDALLNAADSSAGGSPGDLDALLGDLGTASAASAAAPAAAPVGGKPLDLPSFDMSNTEIRENTIDILMDVNLNVKIELGHTRMFIEDVLRLGPGSVVELDKRSGDPVDILVNDRIVGRGEVLVLNDLFCVRVTEILSPKERFGMQRI